MNKLIFLSIILVFTALVLSFYTNVTGTNNSINSDLSLDNHSDRIENDYLKTALSTKNFEGKIELIEKKQFDTITYILTVKNNLIRVDEQKSKKRVSGSMIFNLTNNSILALQHDKKMYVDIPVRTFQSTQSEKIKLTKTNNTKNISGLKCYQWRVKNQSENTEITYWVSGSPYNFYTKFLKLWNKTDKCYQYYLTIPELAGTFPIQQIERTLLRDIRTTITINKISPQKVDTTTLYVPKDYHLFTN